MRHQLLSLLATLGLIIGVGGCEGSGESDTGATVEAGNEQTPTSAGNIDSSEAPADVASPSELYESAKSAYQKAYSAFIATYQAAQDDEAKREAMKLMPKPDEYVSQMNAIADEYPESEAAVDALVWVSAYAHGDQGAAATKRLVESYSSNAKVASVVFMMSYNPSAEAETRLRSLIDNENESVRAAAKYALGSVLLKSDSASSEAAELLQSVVDDHADVEIAFSTRSMKIAPMAEGALNEATRLQIGMVAPEIEGEDLDGVTFKLSDYRGKVVVLDFWGNW